MKLIWIWVIALVCIVFVLCCKHKFSINLNASHDWDYYWNEAIRIKNTKHQPITFFIENLHIHDKYIYSKIKFEKIVRQTATWSKKKFSINLPYLQIKWKDGPTMEYLNNTLYISPDALSRFTDADIVIASIHEILGHHYQENNATNNTREEQETCAMACENVLQSLSPGLVERWKLMRLVRVLIDLRINDKKYKNKPSAKEIYDMFPTKMMTFESIVDSVTSFPGVGKTYFGNSVGKGCACKKIN